MTRAEKNLTFWRSLVGLNASFPSLEEIDDQDLHALMVLDPEKLDEIRASLGSQQLTQILIEPGWGCATLYRYLLKDARDRAMERLVLPVRIDLARVFETGGITFAGLEEEIKRQMIGLLIDYPWEQSLNRDYYFEFINFDESCEIFQYKARSRQFLFDRPPTFRKFLSHFPWIKKPLHEAMNDLLTHFRIQTGLYFHIPQSASSQDIRDLVRSVKSINETGSVQFAALREVYVCGPEQSNEITRDFQRPFNVVRYPKYTAAQVYAMLVNRFAPQVPGFEGRSRTSLNTVFSEDFVTHAWPRARSLGDLIERVRAAMLARLDCDPSAVPFRLDPLPATETPAEDEGQPAETEPAKPRVRFQRKSKAGGVSP